MRGKTQKKYSSQGRGRGKRDDRKTKGRDSEVSSLNNSTNNSVEDIDVENILDTEESRKYARRKIESNWDRYEEPVIDEHEVVDEYDETKDFDYIRQNSASASSHFKFKEEKEWESDLQKNNKDKNVLGLNLLQLASDLNQYGFVKKLEVDSLVPVDCKYCFEGVLSEASCNTKNVDKHSSILNESTISQDNQIQWSFNGVEKYKYLIGLTNDESGTIQKPQSISIATNHTISQANVKEQEESYSSYSSSTCSPQDTATSPSIGSYDENDTLLDQLLMSKVSLETYDDMRKTVRAAASYQGNMTKEETYVKKEKSKPMKTEELDLDMLLESDITSPTSGSKKTTSNAVDSDLDQWLDDILS